MDQEDDFQTPEEIIDLYQEVGVKYNVPWTLLAALHQLNTPPVPTYDKQYDDYIEFYAKKYGVDPNLVRAIIHWETGGSWNPKSKSHVGAVGLMQLTPATCKEYGLEVSKDGNGGDCYIPRKNIEAGTQHIAKMLKKYNGDLKLALAAYNAGDGNVDKYNGIPPFAETRKYVPGVIDLYHRFAGKQVVISGGKVREEVERIAKALVAEKESLKKKERSAECKAYLKEHPSKFGEWSCALYNLKNHNVQLVKVIEEEALKWGPPENTPEIIHKVKYTGGAFPWPCNGRVSSKFGPRWGRHHNGIDIAAKEGTPIISVADGVVVRTKADPGGFGYYVVIDHGGGLTTWYGHMYPETVTVKVGQRVQKGQMIARVGNNGRSTGPHLHFEVRINNKPVDPLPYLTRQEK